MGVLLVVGLWSVVSRAGRGDGVGSRQCLGGAWVWVRRRSVAGTCLCLCYVGWGRIMMGGGWAGGREDDVSGAETPAKKLIGQVKRE